MASKKAYMDALAGLGSDSEASSSGGEEEEQAAEEGGAAGAAAKKAKQAVTLEALQAHGYQGGPSVLFIKENPDDPNWDWGSGQERKGEEPDAESYEQRESNRAAGSTAAEESARFSALAVAHAEQLRRDKWQEQQRLKGKKDVTWKQKEKRKRNEGKQATGKDYVQEEKRRGREFGFVSGFDN